jgi:hypothetical protein
MNHKVEMPSDKVLCFSTLANGDFFLFNSDLFMKTSGNTATCFSRERSSVYEPGCHFDRTNVKPRNIKIIVES